MLHLFLLLGFVSGRTWASTGVNSASKLLTDIRLPSTVEPLYYRLRLLPVLEEGNFSLTGSVDLELLCKESTRKIVLHAKELAVDESTLQLSPFNETMLTKRGASPKVISAPPAPVNTAVPADKDAKSIGNKFRTPRPDFRPRTTPKSWKVTRVEYDTDRDFVILHLDNALLPGDKYLLHYEYSGKLNTFLNGFYYSSYNEKSTKSKKLLAVTQMEPVDARRAFPCFDEPAMKAVFEVTLGRKEGMTALSNMPLVSTEPIEISPGWYWDHFEPSVPMSTYLVAFMVSEFAYKSNVNEVALQQTIEAEEVTEIVATAAEPGKTVVRIWARPDAIDQADVALNVTPAILSFFEGYFQAPFPLPKIDLVAVPDFSAGAMENWGLITYRETALLLDPSEALKMSLIYVQRVIAHELAHQWFGNLVTMDWWTDLWLNEGFATFVEGLGVHHIAPEWDYPSLRVLKIQDVMADDSLESSHPISIEVAHPNQIEEIFDSISYYKGGAILRMMNYFLSEATFQQGVANYIQSKKYRNAQQDDLWTALTNQAHEDGSLPEDVNVKTIMDTWTLQMGFPVITVTRNYEDGSITFDQKRFLRLTTPSETAAVNQTANQTTTEDLPTKTATLPLRQSFSRPKKPTNPPGKLRPGAGAGKNKTPSPPTYKWWVPISITSQNSSDFGDDNTRPVLWLTPSKTKDSLNYQPAEDEWILVNVKAAGYYRVNYDERNWAMLMEQLVTDHSVIHPVNRAQILDDAFALASTGLLPYDTALGITKYLSQESHHIPWTTASRELGFISDMLVHTQKYGEFRAYMKSLVTPAYNAVGFVGHEGESVLDTLTRSILVRLACTYGVKDCIRKSKELYAKWVEDASSRIDPDLRSMVYCFAIKYGGVDEWDLGLQKMLNASVAHERDLLLSALGCTREPWLLVKYLALSLDVESGFRRQDGRRIVSSVANNAIGRPIAFRFLRDRWADITKHQGGLTTLLKMMISVTKTMNTKTELEEVKAFLASKSAELATAESSVKKVITGVDVNVHWMDLHQDRVIQALQKHTLVPN